jgi:hypothetical protein
MADSKLIWASTRPADGGVFYRAPVATALPTMADAPWDNLPGAWRDHGWIGDDGITNKVERTTTDHQAFGGDIVKTTQDKYTETLKVTCYESNPTVLETVFGEDNVTVDDGEGWRQVTVNHSSLPHERSRFIARMIEGEKTRLIVVREGQLITVDDIVHVNKGLVKYTMTIMCYKPDETTEAVTELIDEPDVLAPAFSV